MEAKLNRAIRPAVGLYVLVLALAGPSCRQEHSGSTAWDKVRWGMSEQQVSAAYSQATPLQPEKAARTEDGNSAQSVLQIREFDLDGRKFSVQFLFDAGHKLRTVHLNLLSDNPYIIDAAFKDLEARLTEKYGPVAFKSDDDSLGRTLLFRGALYATRGWKLPATTITLAYSRSSAHGERSVSIRYISNEARARSTKGL
jgi:hypothetical protein